MSLPVVFRREAQYEIDEAYAWYEERSVGAGERFLAAVQEVIERVCRRRESCPIMFRDVRRGLTRHFPYGIYFRVRPHRIEVIAVFHGRRDPNILMDRS